MDNNIERTEKRRRNRVFAGIILLVAGTTYLLNQLNLFFVPNWLFSWPMALILIGIITGVKHNFRNPGWFYMVLVGGIFLVNLIVPSVQVAMLWPLILISIGVRMLFFRENRWCRQNWEQRKAWRREHWERRNAWRHEQYKADPASL
jgi:hypothetical protein